MTRISITNKGMHYMGYDEWDRSFLPEGSVELLDRLWDNGSFEVNNLSEIGISQDAFVRLLRDDYIQIDEGKKIIGKWKGRSKGRGDSRYN